MEKTLLESLKRFSPEKMQKVPVFTSDHLFYDLYCLEPGQSQKPHSHGESDKIYLTLEGRPTVRIGEEEDSLNPGETVIAPVGMEHGVSNRTEYRAVLLVVMAPKPD